MIKISTNGGVEKAGEKRVEAVADQAAALPDAGNAGNPDKHKDTGEVDREGDAVVLGAENFDGKIDQQHWDKVGSDANDVLGALVDATKHGATVAKPSDDGKNRQRQHQNGDDLAPKTAGKLMRGPGFLGAAPGGTLGGFVSGCFFALFGRHNTIIAHFVKKHKGDGGRGSGEKPAAS